jgi:WD40 repeat protein
VAAGGCANLVQGGDCDGGEIRLWVTAISGAAPIVLNGLGRASVSALAFSNPDGKALAAGDTDGNVRLWTLDEIGATPTILPGPAGVPVKFVGFSPDGSILIAGGSDGTVQLWALDESGATRMYLPGSAEAAVSAFAFSPDGQDLAMGSVDGTVRVWPTTQRLADMVCDRVWRNLSPGDEWNRYVDSQLTYQQTCLDLPPGPKSGGQTNKSPPTREAMPSALPEPG